MHVEGTEAREHSMAPMAEHNPLCQPTLVADRKTFIPAHSPLKIILPLPCKQVKISSLE